MKIIFVIGLMLIINIFNYAQQNSFNADIELQKFVEKGGKYIEVNPGMFRLTYANGYNKILYLTQPKSFIENINNIGTTIINVWEIDTTLYAHKFRFWQRVDIASHFAEPLFIEDINNNGRIELYAIKGNEFPGVGMATIIEQNTYGIFDQLYLYDSTCIFFQGIGNVNGDRIKEVHLRTTDTLNGKFYKADTLSGLPTKFDFIFYYSPNQIGNERFVDFDNNGITDCLFIDQNTPSKIIISDFIDSLNNFSTVFELSIDYDVPVGFAIGDFDQDGKTEIVFGTALKKVYIIEAKSENEYQVIWQGDAPTYNAYMITSTNDIDGNGKPEFWVGGQDHLTGISTFWAYESNGQNNYLPVASIELRYLVSLYTNYLQAYDIDNDGKEELIINIGNYLLILKFTGQPDQHSYEVYYAKVGELTEPTAYFRPVSVYDLNNDGRKDILIPMDKYVAPNTVVFSYILVQDRSTFVSEDLTGKFYTYYLYQNYPNPFSAKGGTTSGETPSTIIKFVMSNPGNADIKVYNSLGKEITTLFSEYLPSGEKEINWNGKDNNGSTVPSGVYFIQMTAGSYSQTIKAVVLK